MSLCEDFFSHKRFETKSFVALCKRREIFSVLFTSVYRNIYSLKKSVMTKT